MHTAGAPVRIVGGVRSLVLRLTTTGHSSRQLERQEAEVRGQSALRPVQHGLDVHVGLAKQLKCEWVRCNLRAQHDRRATRRHRGTAQVTGLVRWEDEIAVLGDAAVLPHQFYSVRRVDRTERRLPRLVAMVHEMCL